MAKLLFISFIMLSSTACSRLQKSNFHIGRKQSGKVQHIGTMRETVRLGKTASRVTLRDLPKKNLYAVGPLEHLAGEITVFGNKAFVTEVDENGTISTNNDWDAGAPFLVYSQVHKWREIKVQKSVKTIKDLEMWLDKTLSHFELPQNEPFPFLIKTSLARIQFHILKKVEAELLNLNPHEQHDRRKVKFEKLNSTVTLVGFFSRQHQGVFTHHDKFIHVHAIDNDEQFAGHVDELEFDARSELTVLIPAVQEGQ